MSNLSKAFTKGKALITYITLGDPSLSATEKLVLDLVRAGADIIELGIPFSDPLADGPVIQASHQRALKKNASLADGFKLVARLRKKISVPLCFMLSYNLVYQYGVDKFYKEAARVGLDGVIIPDLPPEECRMQNAKCRIKEGSGIDTIFLVAPTSTEERIELAAKASSGFIYLVSSTGITGKRKSFAEDLKSLVKKIRRRSKLPIAIGFGISGPKQAAEMARLADGVIVGSAIVDLIAKKRLKAVPKFVASLRQAIDAG
ncbi:MAG: tryptophan synthase subunit alpha [Candidatus Saganbacteria bacterium]|nr:tryptophan synthase subunit alpha [Candidatus Saganbacteria bacterium]